MAQPLPPGCRVLACKVLMHELRHLGVADGQAVYLDQGLHRYPDDLRRRVGEELARLERDPAVDTVILGYGYCGGGLEGLCGRRARLVAPRVHDCIPLLLGRRPPAGGVGAGGTFYLSPGWVDFGKTPHTEYFVTARKYDQETAMWCGQQILKGYAEVALIRQGPLFKPHQRQEGRAFASLFGLAYRETPGDLAWLARLLRGQPGEGVLAVEPGLPLSQDMFQTPGEADPAGVLASPCSPR